MLPNPALRPAYDRVVWVYVYRDFSRQGQDREAERTSLRFGVTSWPQLFLADPATLEILEHTGREVAGFLAAVDRVKVERRDPDAVLARVQAAEKRAEEIERRRSVKLATAGFDDEDILVRFAALRVLAEKAPKVVAARAGDLLAVANDPFRYEVCAVLEAQGGDAARDALEALVADPKGSLNPNVLRIRAVEALAACGNAGSVDAIAPLAASGEYFNGLTGIAVDALATIAERHPNARPAARKALREAYPPPPEASDERAVRACVALAKRVHAALGSRRPFPHPYDDKARRTLMEE